jgi:hypothetical protein
VTTPLRPEAVKPCFRMLRARGCRMLWMELVLDMTEAGLG